MAGESTVTLREPQSAVIEPTEPSHYKQSLRINFYHPAYEPPHNLLLTLQGLDHPDGGIHHNTALVACAIVAGNQWSGYMTDTRDGPRITATCDEVLRGKEYYFHVPDPRNRDGEPVHHPPYRYPIIPSFREWQFPHGDLPEGWKDIGTRPPTTVPPTAHTNMATSIRTRDQPCCLSGYRDCVSRAHLCPRAELDWFANNSMSRYGLQTQPIGAHFVDDVRNTISLRHDLHRDFDNCKFVFVPKKSESTPETVIVAHVLQPTYELGLLYHNAQLHPTTDDIPREFFLARFAWMVFPLVQGFLGCGVSRLLIRAQTAEDQRVVETNGATCRLLASLPKASSRKRQRLSDSSDE